VSTELIDLKNKASKQAKDVFDVVLLFSRRNNY